MPLTPGSLLSKRTTGPDAKPMAPPDSAATQRLLASRPGAPQPAAGAKSAPDPLAGQPGFQTPRDLTTAATAGLPGPVAAIMRAFQSEIGEPIQRQLPTAITGVRESGAPGVMGVGQAAADFAQVGFAVTPAGRLVSGAGMVAQAAIDYASGNPDIARTVVTLGQSLLGAKSLVKAIRGGLQTAGTARNVVAEGAELLKPQNASKIAQPVRSKIEQLGRYFQSHTSAELNLRRTTGMRDISAAVDDIVKAAPSIGPTDPAYAMIRGTIQAAQEDIRVRGPAGDLIAKIDKALTNGTPVDTNDVAALRSALTDKTKFKAATRQGGPATVDPIGELRIGLNTTLETHAPPDLATKFSQSRRAFVTNYIEPAKALDGLVNVRVTPAQAFERVMNLKDQKLFRSMMQTIDGTPGLRGKLRAGFVERLADAQGNLRDPQAALTQFRELGPQMLATGIFNTNEIHALEQLVRTENIPRMMDAFSVLASTGMKRGQVLPSVIGVGGVSIFGPLKMLSVIAASGSILEFRRLSMLAPDTGPMAKRLAAIVVGRVDDYAKDAARVSDDFADGPDQTD